MYTLWLDLEGFGDVKLKSHGAHRYSETGEIMLVSYAWGKQPADVWDLTGDDGVSSTERLPELQQMIDAADVITTHGDFDPILLKAKGVILPPEKHENTMIVALQHGFPGGLDKLCEILDVPPEFAKDKDGKKLIDLFCSPTPKNHNRRRYTRHTHPEQWARFVNYARLDVEAMRYVAGCLPRWNCTESERQLWYLDKETNERGMGVDAEHAHAAIAAFDPVRRAMDRRVRELTGGEVTAVSQRDALLRYLQEELGYQGDNIAKGTLEYTLRHDCVDPVMRELLELRMAGAVASPAKYKALLGALSLRDGRLHDTLQFCGASRTGRDAGRIFQPQNLPRPRLSRLAIEHGMEALKAGCADLIYDVGDLVVSAVRGTIAAAPGHKLIVADLSNIEGRVLAWLAGEDWKVEAFKAYDRGEGHDLYILTAARILGKPPELVTKDERDKMGKVSELACGYQGWVGAFRRMGGAKVESLSDQQIVQIAGGWRDAHPRIKAFWYDMEAAARNAIKYPGDVFSCRTISFDVVKGPDRVPYLRMHLPSGRFLCYRQPQDGANVCVGCAGQGVVRPKPGLPFVSCPDCDGAGAEGRDGLKFQGTNDTNYQWGDVDTYGGMLTENCVQAIARDIFMHGMRRASMMGFPIILRVHDELVAEVPEGSNLTLQGLIDCMTYHPQWATGLPLAAAGFESVRYYKG